MKQALAQIISKRVKNGEVIGLGSGTTTEIAIEQIGKRVLDEGLNVFGVPTSLRSAKVAAANGINVCDIRVVDSIDWAFDGADEVDPDLNLMKGRGAAMLVEKIVASQAKSLTIIVTEEKIVKKLGEKFAIPIEVVGQAALLAESEFQKLGATEISLRSADRKYGEVITDSGNLVFDVVFPVMDFALQSKLKLIPGVVETGLFLGFSPEVLVATQAGIYALTKDDSGLVQRTELS
ncbi:UNVERIFIED_CONTAM: hypothetical protein GTU68_028105 [Idotea baltica]|nr:hypothetical protein [Idotea baltica]